MTLGRQPQAVRLARPFVPALNRMGLDEMLPAMSDQIPPGHPLAIDVTDREDGERVQVRWG